MRPDKRLFGRTYPVSWDEGAGTSSTGKKARYTYALEFKGKIPNF